MTSITAIYVYYNCPDEILDSLNSLEQTSEKLIKEIIIVDNASKIPLPLKLKRLKNIKNIQNKKNLGYGVGLNQGAKIATGKYLLLLNPDTIFTKNSINLMLKKLQEDQKIGVVGPTLLDSKGNIQLVGNGLPFIKNAIFAFTFLNKIFPNNKWSKEYFLRDFDRKKEKEIPVICGACMMVRKSVFEKIGGFDKRFFLYFEESDLCLRIKKAGFKVWFLPDAKVVHLIGKSSNDKRFIRKNFEKSRLEFFKKYHKKFFAYSAEYFIRFANKL